MLRKLLATALAVAFSCAPAGAKTYFAEVTTPAAFHGSETITPITLYEGDDAYIRLNFTDKISFKHYPNATVYFGLNFSEGTTGLYPINVYGWYGTVESTQYAFFNPDFVTDHAYFNVPRPWHALGPYTITGITYRVVAAPELPAWWMALLGLAAIGVAAKRRRVATL